MDVMEILGAYLGELVRLVNEMAPYLLLGFLFAGILRVFFPKGIITRYMGQNNFRSVLNASLLGIPMPLCSCGVLPTAIGFYKNGASRGSTISFLISTPQTGVDSILATYSLLGLPFAIIRPVVALLTGVFGGMLGTRAELGDEQGTLKNQDTVESHERSLKELFRYGFVELLQDISKWLIIGILMAALLSVLIPADFFTERISSEYLAMLMMLLASVPLYICATGSIPIAAVLLMKGLSPGAALVAFLLRRVLRLCQHYGSNPRHIISSATLANPQEFAGRLCGVPFTLVAGDGAPRGPRQFVLINPYNEGNNRQSSIHNEAADLITRCVSHHLQTLAFTGSRKMAELVALWAREGMVRYRKGRPDVLCSYRAGVSSGRAPSHRG